MDPKIETVRPRFQSLVTGHFHEGPGYRTWRQAGTDDWLLVATLDGAGRFGYSGGEFFVSAGDLALLPPGTRHDYGTAAHGAGWELLWVHFHLEPAKQTWLGWPEAASGVMTLHLENSGMWDKVASRLLDMHRLATGPQRRRELFAMNALEETLLWCDALNPRSEQSRLDPRVLAAMDFLCRSLAAPPALDVLAAGCGLSMSRLAHLFRSQSGLTPLQFLEQQRLNRACQLLDFTSRSIEEIAAEVGYENPFYFTLRFKRSTGLSPRDYRKRKRQKETG